MIIWGDIMTDDMYLRKSKQIAGFLYEGLLMGYTLNAAWKLLLNSKEGRGILNEEVDYIYKHTGRACAMYADIEHGKEYKKRKREVNIVLDQIIRLGRFIEFVHIEYNLDYENIFTKCSIAYFYKETHVCLGNYDSRLAEKYIL